MQILSKTMILLSLIALLLGACELESDTACDGFSKDVVMIIPGDDDNEGEYIIDDVNTDTDIARLENIECIDGTLSIRGTMLNSLAGLESLQIVVGDLDIWGNDALTSLNGLNNLTSVGDELLIVYNDDLTSLSGLDNLTSVGELHIYANDVLPQCIVDEFVAGVTVIGNGSITSNGSTDPGLCP